MRIITTSEKTNSWTLLHLVLTKKQHQKTTDVSATHTSSAATEVCTVPHALKGLSLAESQLFFNQLELFLDKLMSDKMNELLI